MTQLDHFTIEADAASDAASRLLDLLAAVDRPPRRLRLDRTDDALTIRLALDPAAARAVPLAARFRQIVGVRRVTPHGAMAAA